MIKLLYHVCDYKVSILKPENYDNNIIFLSEDNFICALGKFLYIFNFETLNNNFPVEIRVSSGMYMNYKNSFTNTIYNFRSKNLGKEYLIRHPVDVNDYALGIAENFNVCVGKFEEFVMTEVMERENNKIKDLTKGK